MSHDDKILSTLALTFFDGLGPLRQRALLDHFGSADELFSLPTSELSKIGGTIGEKLSDQTLRTNAFHRAERELHFADQHGIDILINGESSYSERLMQCPDAPIVLYRLGHQQLNGRRMVAMVGTRNASRYGKDVARHIVSDLAKIDPTIVIVSGLAYGIDIESHRAALDFGMDTVAILAHGLDRIYPPVHRPDAVKITNGHGALLTEFPILTEPIGANFLQRNRIVAGLCDATIVVESAQKGGSISTARLTVEYNRELFAVPGRMDDKLSNGCNKLISDRKAEIFFSVDEFFKKMNWQTNFEPELPFNQETMQLTDVQAKIVTLLKTNGAMQVNEIAQMMTEPFSVVSATLTELFFNDILQQLPGDVYDLSFDYKSK